ncbi:MAG: DNA polymerase III subunit gamma/tau [Clostridiales bacterium]|nr:DNA polymerase III subunit gamma/tau [Clostridiales bacterium]
MSYLAFYRTFRPRTFDEVVRQEHIVRILKNQIATDKVGHAYLFCGPRGTGKTTLAKIFARAINCEHPVDGSPCGKCAACKALSEGSNLDVYEIDAASNNGVDEMRDLREKVQYPPVAGKYKVYIIDEVHMLTASAFNAVLKTLEEPPRHAIFILATTEPQKIPATILSRCMRFDFKLIPRKDLEELIKSVFIKTGKEFEDEAVTAIARAGAGSARDSLSIADMCASYSRGKLTYNDVNAVLGSAEYARVSKICGAILEENASEALSAVEEILATGKSVGVLIKDMLSFLNECTVVKVCRNAKEIVNLPEETYAEIARVASLADGHKLLRVTEILSSAENEMKYSSSARITLETAVFKSATPLSDYNIDALIGKINALEQKLKSGEYSIPAKPVITAEKPIKPEEKPVVRETAPAVKEKPVSVQDDEQNPFTAQAEKKEAVQGTLLDNASNTGSSGQTDKGTVFAKFIKSLRTTRKNAVLFTLCMDLEHSFEGDKIIFTTDNDAVFKALNRNENSSYIAEVLAELGVYEHEIKYKSPEQSDYEKALEELKQNFSGTDIDIK